MSPVKDIRIGRMVNEPRVHPGKGKGEFGAKFTEAGFISMCPKPLAVGIKGETDPSALNCS